MFTGQINKENIETERTTKIERQLQNIIGKTQTTTAAKEDVISGRLHGT